MQTIFSIQDRLERWGMLICMLFSLVALSISITSRYVFMRPLAWTDELTTYMFMAMTLLGASASVKGNMELKVDALYEAFPRWQGGMNVMLHLFRLGTAVTFICFGFNFLVIEISMDTVTPILQIPNTVIAGMLPVFGILLGLRSIEGLIELWHGRYRRK